MNPCSHRYKSSTNVFAALFALLGLLLAFPAYADTVVSGCSEAALRSALGGGGVVSFGSNCSITLAAPIALGSGITIDAAGHQVTLSGGNAVSLFTINGSGVTLKGLTLANGRSTNGGALYINPGAAVTATNCTFANNSATGADGAAGYNGANNDTGSGGNGGNGTSGMAGLGGAIYNAGILKLLNCTLNTNSASGGKGGNGGNGGTGGGTLGVGGNGGNGGNGAPAYGGAVYNISNLTVINCFLSGNTAVGGNAGVGGTNGTGAFPGTIGKGGAGAVGSGAGIYNAKNLNVQASSFSGNIAFGGNSTAGGNQANGVGSTGAPGGDAAGGAVWSTWWGIVTNSTFINNGAVGGNGGDGGPGSGTFPTGGTGGNGGNGWGGGVHNAGALNMVNCTVASCGAWGGTNGAAGSGTYAGSPGQMGSGLGGDIAMSAGSFTLANSILSTNISGGNGFGAISDAGHNLSSDASLTLNAPGSHASTDPKLGAWGMNGGPTGTMPLLAGSPAINQLSPASAPATDQRGFPRPLPLGQLSDIGAYEYEGASAPVFTLLPVDQIVVQSAPATFRVAAVGAATLQYQWFLSNAIAIPGATSTAFTITTVFSTNKGPYSVKVSNGIGSTNSGQVSVHLAAAITAQPSNQVLLPGSNATFSVTATGDALQYQWSFNSTDIPGATNSSLVITNAQTNNVGAYRVEVFNGFSTTNSANARLDLLPTILTQPADQTTVVGGNATFSVVAVGSPTLGYQWRFGGTNISGATGSTYALSQVTSTNAGTYSVLITNSVGQTNSRLARLIVNPPGFTISGQITNTPSPVQVLLLQGVATNQNVTSDNGGNFTFVGLSAGTYTLQPIPAGCRHFVPTSMTITVGPNATGGNFGSVADAYVLSGRFTTDGTNGVTGVLVTLEPGAGAFLTGTNGDYAFSNLCAGTYTVSGSAGQCSTMTPSSLSAAVGPSDATGQNFLVAPNVYTVSGTIVEGAAGLGGVAIQLSGTNSVLTDGNGNYTLTNICPGTYTITPVLACQRFSPTNRTITVGPSLTQVNFTGYTNDVFSIWGRVTTNGVDGLAGVSIRAGDRTATTDANGYYVLSNICPGTNQVVPTLAGSGFTPAVSNVNVVADTSGVNFLAYPAFTVGGTISEVVSGTNSRPLIGVTVQLTGGGTNATVLTGTNGIYLFSSLVSNLYTVTPSFSCYLFTPTNQTVQVSPTNAQADFQGTNDAVHTIAGNISAGVTGLGNIAVQLTAPGLTNTVTTDAGGNYRFTNLCSAVYTVTPTQSCMLFYPPNHVVTLTPSGPDAIATDFSGYQESLTIRGQVVAALGGTGVPGVAISAGGQTNLTDVNGYFVFANLCSGTYTVQPLLTGYLFGPPISFINLVSDTNVNFTAFPVLAISRATNGLPQVRFGAGAGLAYQLQVSTNLSLTNWQTILVTNNLSSQAALLQFIDSDSRSFPQRFFRIAEVPWLVLHRGTNGLLQVSFVANSGANYQLQASSDLVNWQQVLSTNVPVWPLSIQFTEPTNYPSRYYRLHP